MILINIKLYNKFKTFVEFILIVKLISKFLFYDTECNIWAKFQSKPKKTCVMFIFKYLNWGKEQKDVINIFTKN
jgi:hypothetical protein